MNDNLPHVHVAETPPHHPLSGGGGVADQEGVMDENRFREMSRQRDSKLWDESRFEDPNHGDDMPRTCPSCCRDEHCFIRGVCKCGELVIDDRCEYWDNPTPSKKMCGYCPTCEDYGDRQHQARFEEE